jgi:hypothetical protein
MLDSLYNLQRFCLYGDIYSMHFKSKDFQHNFVFKLLYVMF